MKKQRKSKQSKPSTESPVEQVVDELRAVRSAMWKEAGEDLNAFFDLAKREGTEVRRQRAASVKRTRGKKGRAA